MKKILLLGGSIQQVIAIQTAKRLGYYTVLCDFLADNPGQYVADKFYLISTTDKEEVLEVAKKEAIDGILAYASDPAAPSASYVAEMLDLPGAPYQSVEILCNKDRFRRFLAGNGFNAPKANGYGTAEKALIDISNYRFPIIIKPVDSSGSKGVTVLHEMAGLDEALEIGFSFSRSHRIIVEEFIEKKHPYLIGGDIFVVDGKVILWGLMNCHRDGNVNPLVPVGKSYPLELRTDEMEHVKSTLQDIVDKLHINSGAINVELVVDKNDRVWPIDIGPRSGGNMIPDLLGYIFEVDVVEMSLKAAMGEKVETDISDGIPFYATYNLHSAKEGIYEGIDFSLELEEFIVKKYLYKKQGDEIEFFDNATKALGIVFMKFDSMEQMLEMMDNSKDWIEVVLKR